MYEGWHVVFSNHAQTHMAQRMIEHSEVLRLIAEPEQVGTDKVHGGKLLSRYLPDWDRILTVAVVERPDEAVLLVKTVLWSSES